MDTDKMVFAKKAFILAINKLNSKLDPLIKEIDVRGVGESFICRWSRDGHAIGGVFQPQSTRWKLWKNPYYGTFYK